MALGSSSSIIENVGNLQVWERWLALCWSGIRLPIVSYSFSDFFIEVFDWWMLWSDGFIDYLTFLIEFKMDSSSVSLIIDSNFLLLEELWLASLIFVIISRSASKLSSSTVSTYIELLLGDGNEKLVVKSLVALIKGYSRF